MTLVLYNTMTRAMEPFAPLHAPRVTFYTCGPTVWNYAHIGNFRTFLFQDLLRRWLEQSGYEVCHIMNLTDVDDRTIKAAAAAQASLVAHTEPFVRAFFEDRDFLRIRPAHVYPRATTSIPAMVRLVEQLLAKGVACKGDDGSVYFAIGKFPTYGRLSRLDTREIRVGARVASDEYAKENPSDFALWKKADALDEQVGAAWDAPFGRGRPGWHLECSAMSLDEIGRRFGVRTLDIHAGGVDLIFPHHEDEIAQSEAVTGEPFARYWVHGAFMQVGGTKMSKRFGNFLTVRDLQEEGVDAGTFRLLVFQTHYRKELDYNDAALASARDGSRRLDIFRDRLRTAGGLQEDEPFRALAETLKTRVTEALNDDLNAPRAVAALFDFVTEGNRLLDTGVRPGERVLAAWRWVDAVLDLCPTPPPVDDELVRWVEERIAARTRARGARDFKEADRIREELRARGVEIEDTPGGTKWRRA
ncbi:MAG TPA: cysteine--tRNA ligase [Gemmatimonadales bacterium]|nr:cysteine--tRNA ligase [Gemmatimonadales bacterium]